MARREAQRAQDGLALPATGDGTPVPQESAPAR